MNNYYIPQTKKDLITWIHAVKPAWDLKGLKIKQLYAIFYKLKEEREASHVY